jgi:hypothetical protein
MTSPLDSDEPSSEAKAVVVTVPVMPVSDAWENLTPFARSAVEWRAGHPASSLRSPSAECSARAARARELWRDARTPELRALLRQVYPFLKNEPVPPPKPEQIPNGPDEDEERADARRWRLKRAWPDEFADGERCAFHRRFNGKRERGGYPLGFHRWPLDRRNAWFAGYTFGRIERRRAENADG